MSDHNRGHSVRRAILLMELSNGVQMGYDVDVRQAIIAIDNPIGTYMGPLEDIGYPPDLYGTVTVEGRFHGRIVDDSAFTPEREPLPSGSPAIEARPIALEAGQ